MSALWQVHQPSCSRLMKPRPVFNPVVTTILHHFHHLYHLHHTSTLVARLDVLTTESNVDAIGAYDMCWQTKAGGCIFTVGALPNEQLKVLLSCELYGPQPHQRQRHCQRRRRRRRRQHEQQLQLSLTRMLSRSLALCLARSLLPSFSLSLSHTLTHTACTSLTLSCALFVSLCSARHGTRACR